jgi:hypothetical protein
MSDIAIFSDPWSIAFLYLLFGSPGIVIGAIAGALAWRTHRVWGTALGAAAGWALCIGALWVWVSM